MQRPVMNPMDLSDAAAPQGRWIRLGWLWRIVKLLVRVLLTDPLAVRRQKLKVEEGTRLGRFIRGLLYRLAFVPVLLELIIIALVFTGTHPPRVAAQADPATQGIYYDPVNFLSDDGVSLEGWLVPAVDARVVIEQKDDAIKKKYPAVVLAHDFGGDRQQLLPLVRPLHEAGMVVLLLSMRGGASTTPVGQTFGLNESMDINASVEMLRRRAYIDPRLIAVAGIGTGATAALLAAENDPQIAALVLENPVSSFDEAIMGRVVPPQSYLHWMRPWCKWTFEVVYHVDAEASDLHRFHRLMEARPVLMLDPARNSAPFTRAQTRQQVQFFLSRHLLPAQALARSQ